jgi:hypothetical protein
MSQILVTGEAKIRDIQGPVVANSGVITALDGAASQYVRGDGTLADFPTSSGGGSSVSYYLNGSVNQGTFGGSTYYQMSKNAIVGTGTNFSTSANGLIAQFITDANDPDVVSIPSGNWNIEFFMSVSASSGALASFYVEIYKYDGSTFTLLATNVATPEQLTNTTTVDAYFTSVAMPLSAMAVTDRLAVRIFANVASKTVTLYTEDNRLCQIVTTFSKGMLSLNNLTDQSQYLTTGTSGTNFNIVSSGDTHTFNLPVASASNTGKLSSTDWSTFNGKIGGSGTINKIPKFTGTGTLGNSLMSDNGNSIIIGTNDNIILDLNNGTTNNTLIRFGNSNGYRWTLGNNYNSNADSFDIYNVLTNTTVLSISQSSVFSIAGSVNMQGNATTTGGIFTQNGLYIAIPFNGGYLANYTNISAQTTGIGINLDNGTGGGQFILQTAAKYNYTFPAATGTLALTSNLSAYLPLTGGTLTGALSGTSATFSDNLGLGTSSPVGQASNNRVLQIVGAGTGIRAQIKLTNSVSGATGTDGLMLSYDDQLDGYLYNFENGGLLFGTNNAVRLTITSAGNVGIGTTPSAWGSIFSSGVFQVKNSSLLAYNNNTYLSTNAYFTNSGDNYIGNGFASRYIQTSGQHIWESASNNTSGADAALTLVERMRITSGGNVIIGGTTAQNNATNRGNLTINGTTSILNLSISDTNGGYLFHGGTDMLLVNAKNGAQLFYTNDTERMRITSGGEILINRSSSLTPSYKLQVSGINGGILTNATGAGDANFLSSSSGIGYHFFGDDGTNAKFFVQNNGTINSTSVTITLITSDRESKTDIKDYDKGLAEVLQMKPRYYKYKDNLEKQEIGFIAQEIDEALEGSMIDGVIKNEETGENYKTYKVEWFPLLVKAIQEQTQIIKDLESRIVSLESK